MHLVGSAKKLHIAILISTLNGAVELEGFMELKVAIVYISTFGGGCLHGALRKYSIKIMNRVLCWVYL